MLAEVLPETGPMKWPVTRDALICYADGKFNAIPNVLVDLVCSELYQHYFPKHANEFAGAFIYLFRVFY
jgi:hypothetical protein